MQPFFRIAAAATALCATAAIATPPSAAAVINLTVIPAARAAAILRTYFPHARISVDRHANAVIVAAPAEEIQQMRTIVEGIDVRDPQRAVTDAIALHVLRNEHLIRSLATLFPSVRFAPASANTIIVRGTTADIAEVKSLVGSLDVAPVSPAPAARTQDTIHVEQANSKALARTLARQIPALHASVSGSTIILTGSADAIQKAKTLAQSLDTPPLGTSYTQIYRLHAVDAGSVADLISRSYPNVKVVVDQSINALSVFGTAADQERIAAAIAQMDAPQAAASSSSAPPAYGDGNVDVVQLNSAIPGQGGTPSTTASDIAQAVQQSLGTLAPDLRLTPLADKAQIILAGSPQSIRIAKELIERLDVPQPLVALDTEVLEVDESVAKNLGFQIPGAYISTTYTELQPAPNALTGQPGKIGGLQPFTRTPITFQAEVNFLIQQGNGRVLADPRVTTVSGRTANISAGDTINVLTQTGGGITPITQQLQSFPTGVSLDITPIVNRDGTVMVSVHPRVSSVVPGSAANAVPDIAQREATTVVKLRNDETLIIGGLIQETNSRQVTKIPFLGDLPLIGHLFRDSNVNSSRNELIIAITPHILQSGAPEPPPQATLELPTAPPLPRAELTPAPNRTPILVTPRPSIAPAALAPPSGFSQTNVFTYGSAPSDTYASDNEAPRIYYVQFSPTVLSGGTAAHVFVVTSSNVKRVVFGYPGRETTLSMLARSKWQADYAFNTFGLPTNSTVNLVVSAYGANGSAATVQVPVSIIRQP